VQREDVFPQKLPPPNSVDYLKTSLPLGTVRGRSQPRSGGAPASGRWARGWVRTNVSPSAAGVRGSRPSEFFGIFLIPNSAFWCILWLRKLTLSLFLSRPVCIRGNEDCWKRLPNDARSAENRGWRPRAGWGSWGGGSKPHQLGVRQ